MRSKFATAALGLLVLAGCDQIDPLKRPYMWQEVDANVHNIAAMAVNPADLTRGRETARRQAIMESEAVDRAWSGRLTPLLAGGNTSAGGLSTSSSGSGPTTGGN